MSSTNNLDSLLVQSSSYINLGGAWYSTVPPDPAEAAVIGLISRHRRGCVLLYRSVSYVL